MAATGAVCAPCDPASGGAVAAGEGDAFLGFLDEALLPLGEMQATAGTASGEHWSKRFSNFTKNTAAKIASRSVPHMQPKLNVKRRRASSLPQKLVGVFKVAFLCDATPLVPGVTREDVPAFMCCVADLVVVPEWSFLQKAETEISLLHLLCIFARGVPVVTRSAMLLADGDPRLVSPSSIIRFLLSRSKTFCSCTANSFGPRTSFCMGV